MLTVIAGQGSKKTKRNGVGICLPHPSNPALPSSPPQVPFFGKAPLQKRRNKMQVLEKEKEENLPGAGEYSRPILKAAYFKDGIYSTDIEELTPSERLEVFMQYVSKIAKSAILKHDVEGEMRVIKGALVGQDENYIYFVRAIDGKVFKINHKNVRGIEMNNFTGAKP